jgi:AcrR family transcriptional regulator
MIAGPSSADGRRARSAEHRATRRADLVDAAIRANAQHGPAHGMDDIAAEAGVTKPVIYRYFADRGDLHLAVGQHVATGVLARIHEQQRDDRPPRENLSAAVDAYFELIERSPDLYRFVVSRPILERAAGTSSSVVHDYDGLIAATVADSIALQLRAAGVDAGGAEPWAFALVGSARAVGEWWLERHTMSRAALTAYLVEMSWSGLEGLYAQGVRGRARAGVAADG